MSDESTTSVSSVPVSCPYCASLDVSLYGVIPGLYKCNYCGRLFYISPDGVVSTIAGKEIVPE